MVSIKLILPLEFHSSLIIPKHFHEFIAKDKAYALKNTFK